MSNHEKIEREAKEFRDRYGAVLAREGVTGEFYCDSQREEWLDELRDAYSKALRGDVPEWTKSKKAPPPKP